MIYRVKPGKRGMNGFARSKKKEISFIRREC